MCGISWVAKVLNQSQLIYHIGGLLYCDFFYKRSAICHLWTRIHTVLYESWTLWECENVRKTHQRAHVLYLSTFFMFVQWLFQRHRLLLYFFHLMPTFTTSYLVPITSILPPFVSTPYSLSELVLRLRTYLPLVSVLSVGSYLIFLYKLRELAFKEGVFMCSALITFLFFLNHFDIRHNASWFACTKYSTDNVHY